MSRTGPRELLRRALVRGRLPHALLFAGPEGTGRREAARWLARSLLCQQGSQQDGCGRCLACTKVDRQSHPDLTWIEPDGQFIKIEQVRRLIHDVAFKPLEGRARLLVLNQAHCLSEASANALLKTLEEPPAHATLVLITAKPESLLSTIRSRAHRVSFLPQGVEAVAQTLQQEDGLGAEEAWLRARQAQGSLGAARALDLEQLSLLNRRALELMELALAGRPRSDDASALLEASRELSRSSEETRGFLTALKTLLRDASVSRLDLGDEALIDRSEARRVAEVGRRLGLEGAIETLARIEDAEEDFLHNASRRLVLDSLLLELWRSAST